MALRYALRLLLAVVAVSPNAALAWPQQSAVPNANATVTVAGEHLEALQPASPSFNSSARKLLVLPKGGVQLKYIQEVKDCSIRPEYVQYTLDRITNSPLTMSPYPHVYITEIFHPEFYPCIVSHLPGNAHFFANILYVMLSSS